MKRISYKFLLTAFALVALTVGSTAALLMASSSPIINTFSLAQVDNEVIEDQGGSEETKVVTVKNTGSSSTFVRAQAVVSAGVSTVEFVSALPSKASAAEDTIYVCLGSGWEMGDSGYYYYKGILDSGETTSPLVSGVRCGANIDADSFQVVVYAESVLASGSYSLSAAQTAFSSVGG